MARRKRGEKLTRNAILVIAIESKKTAHWVDNERSTASEDVELSLSFSLSSTEDRFLPEKMIIYTILGGKLIKNFRSLVRHERRQLTPQLVLGNLIPGDMNSLLGENKYNPPQNEVEVERPQQKEQSDFIIRGHKKSEF